ncbi:hypothetical protein BHM03_00014815 [Ensete ventricosum]|nr:hypothetical protein BHM03_00014815 [Ensete ventricosum]
MFLRCLRMMYESMKAKVEGAMERGYVGNDVIFDAEERELFEKWKGFARHDHPSVIQVIFSFINAPVILTLDCDMYCNNPRAPLHALCYFLDPADSTDLAFGNGWTPGTQLRRHRLLLLATLFTWHRLAGFGVLRTAESRGSGCLFLRTRHQMGILGNIQSMFLRCCFDDANVRFVSSIMQIGFRYGSLVEDYHTGYRLHCEGWKSVFCDPARPAFLGDGPKNLNDVLSQCKRWCVGLYEVTFSRFNPLTFGTTKASFSMGLIYAHYACWGTWCVPITVYGLLPPLALLYQTPLFPKVSDPWFSLYAYLFTAAYGQDLVEFLADGATFRRWWSDQRMWMTRGVTSFLFGTIQFGLNHIGISAPGFNVTSKVTEAEQIERYERGVVDLGVKSPFFVALGTVAVVNLSSLVVGIARVATTEGFLDEQFAQLFLSGFVAANCWPIYEAMFLRSDGGRMPRSVTLISLTVAGLLLFMGYLVFHV